MEVKTGNMATQHRSCELRIKNEESLAALDQQRMTAAMREQISVAELQISPEQ